MKFQFVSLEENKSGSVRQTFMEAWNDMYLYVKGLLDLGQMSLQLLETSIWLQTDERPISFYDARDMAIREGWQQPKA